jgi:hypothetical protein
MMSDEEAEALLRGGEDDGPRIATFIAEYQSDCFECGGLIVPGDEAGYVEDDTEATCPECLDKLSS